MTIKIEPPSDKYKLVWSDEFDGDQLDLSKWSYRCLGPRGDAILSEESVKLDGNGNLVLSTRKVSDHIETGMIGTENKFEAKFGYYEARMKFQTEPGHWSAFWLQSPTMAKIGDPKLNGTEIDIIEFFSTDRQSMFTNLHWDGYGDEHKKAGSQHREPALAKGWHVVGLEWTPDEYKFFLNGKEVWCSKEAVSHVEQYIILSLEVRNWAGDISKAKLPDSLMVDYVRVYSKSD